MASCRGILCGSLEAGKSRDFLRVFVNSNNISAISWLAVSEGLPASVKKCGNEFISGLLSSLSGHVLETRPGGVNVIWCGNGSVELAWP